jgi:peptide/nickel transport system ATP-binding protein
MTGEVLIETRDLHKHFPGRKIGILFQRAPTVRAVDGVDIVIHKGETLGLVGESGCGKSTLGRAILRLIEPTAGTVLHRGVELTTLSRSAMRAARRDMQIIFQDPYGSLNPRKTVGATIGEAYAIHHLGTHTERTRWVAEILDRVALPRDSVMRYPHEFSGGQRQRIGIARALALNPGFVVCDEAVSALDVSVQSQIVNLLQDLQQQLGLTYLFISHNLAVVRHISNRVAVMYLGRIVEIDDVDGLFERPVHPYTRALLSAIPIRHPGERREEPLLRGDPPVPLGEAVGCNFAGRCPFVQDRCRSNDPQLAPLGGGKAVACLRAADGSLPENS